MSFGVNLRRSKGHARDLSFTIESTHFLQSKWPHGSTISTSFPFSEQLPQVIFGFHNWYFIMAISGSSATSIAPPPLVCRACFDFCLDSSPSFLSKDTWSSSLPKVSAATRSLLSAYACAILASSISFCNSSIA